MSTLVVTVDNGECILGVNTPVCSTIETINAVSNLIETTGAPETVIEAAKIKLGCGTEECVVSHPTIAAIIPTAVTGSRFKNRGPASNTDLLSNVDIDNLLEKLTYQHKGFYHMEFQMIDFAGGMYGGVNMPPTELGTINLNSLIGKYDCMGVVLNTDVRTGGGIHWLSLFCDFRHKPYTLEYFNSSGRKPDARIQDWLLKSEASLEGKAKVIILSGMVHQKDSDTECGLYSLYYIWNRLNNVPADSFQKKRVTDAMMIKFRKMCFKD